MWNAIAGEVPAMKLYPDICCHWKSLKCNNITHQVLHDQLPGHPSPFIALPSQRSLAPPILHTQLSLAPPACLSFSPLSTELQVWWLWCCNDIVFSLHREECKGNIVVTTEYVWSYSRGQRKVPVPFHCSTVGISKERRIARSFIACFNLFAWSLAQGFNSIRQPSYTWCFTFFQLFVRVFFLFLKTFVRNSCCRSSLFFCRLSRWRADKNNGEPTVCQLHNLI